MTQPVFTADEGNLIAVETSPSSNMITTADRNAMPKPDLPLPLRFQVHGTAILAVPDTCLADRSSEALARPSEESKCQAEQNDHMHVASLLQLGIFRATAGYHMSGWWCLAPKLSRKKTVSVWIPDPECGRADMRRKPPRFRSTYRLGITRLGLSVLTPQSSHQCSVLRRGGDIYLRSSIVAQD